MGFFCTSRHQNIFCIYLKGWTFILLKYFGFCAILLSVCSRSIALNTELWYFGQWIGYTHILFFFFVTYEEELCCYALLNYDHLSQAIDIQHNSIQTGPILLVFLLNFNAKNSNSMLYFVYLQRKKDLKFNFTGSLSSFNFTGKGFLKFVIKTF